MKQYTEFVKTASEDLGSIATYAPEYVSELAYATYTSMPIEKLASVVEDMYVCSETKFEKIATDMVVANILHDAEEGYLTKEAVAPVITAAARAIPWAARAGWQALKGVAKGAWAARGGVSQAAKGAWNNVKGQVVKGAPAGTSEVSTVARPSVKENLQHAGQMFKQEFQPAWGEAKGSFATGKAKYKDIMGQQTPKANPRYGDFYNQQPGMDWTYGPTNGGSFTGAENPKAPGWGYKAKKGATWAGKQLGTTAISMAPFMLLGGMGGDQQPPQQPYPQQYPPQAPQYAQAYNAPRMANVNASGYPDHYYTGQNNSQQQQGQNVPPTWIQNQQAAQAQAPAPYFPQGRQVAQPNPYRQYQYNRM